MDVDLQDTLVVAVSAHALFHLEGGNRTSGEAGVDACGESPRRNEQAPLEPGPAFPLISSLISINARASAPIVDVVVMSREAPDTGLRILDAIARHGLDIQRAFFTQSSRGSLVLQVEEEARPVGRGFA